MSAYPNKKQGQQLPPKDEKKQRIRVSLYSNDRRAIEKVCSEFVVSAKKRDLNVKGPVRFPVKTLRICTRKSPCGEGTKTWDHFQQRQYKRLIDIHAPAEVMKQISQFAALEPNVDVEVTISDVVVA